MSRCCCSDEVICIGIMEVAHCVKEALGLDSVTIVDGLNVATNPRSRKDLKSVDRFVRSRPSAYVFKPKRRTLLDASTFKCTLEAWSRRYPSSVFVGAKAVEHWLLTKESKQFDDRLCQALEEELKKLGTKRVEVASEDKFRKTGDRDTACNVYVWKNGTLLTIKRVCL